MYRFAIKAKKIYKQMTNKIKNNNLPKFRIHQKTI